MDASGPTISEQRHSRRADRRTGVESLVRRVVSERCVRVDPWQRRRLCIARLPFQFFGQARGHEGRVLAGATRDLEQEAAWRQDPAEDSEDRLAIACRRGCVRQALVSHETNP